MNRNLGRNGVVLLISGLIVITLILGVAVSGYAATSTLKEPPDSNKERIIGPPIDGVLTATLNEDGISATVVVVGNCNKAAIVFGPGPFPVNTEPTVGKTFSETTAADIENYRMNGAGPAGCFSTAGGENLIITGVTKFNNTGTAIGADISISVVEIK